MLAEEQTPLWSPSARRFSRTSLQHLVLISGACETLPTKGRSERQSGVRAQP